jgi:hypothetical protein
MKYTTVSTPPTQLVALHAERRPGQHQRRRGPALARDRDEADEQERHHDADEPGQARLPE